MLHFLEQGAFWFRGMLKIKSSEACKCMQDGNLLNVPQQLVHASSYQGCLTSIIVCQ